MTNEAVIVELHGNEGDAIDFTVADGTAISKGSVLEILEPRTATKTTGTAGDVHGTHYFAGIAATDKEADDGATNLGVYTKGIFDLKTNGSPAISAGQTVIISGANTITLNDVDVGENDGMIIGKALEDVADGTDETIEVIIGTR